MKILVIAPHPDDEVLGCGGTIAKYTEQGHKVCVAIVTKGMAPIYPNEEAVSATRAETKKANGFLGVEKTIFMDFPAAMIETVPRYEFNGAFIKLVQDIKPDIVYLPHCGDMQLDHKMVVDAAMVALRPKYPHVVKKILMYETLSETGWDVPNVANEFIPNVYEEIVGYLQKKTDAFSMYKDQISEDSITRSIYAIKALAAFRGSIINVKEAEAFSLVREIVQ